VVEGDPTRREVLLDAGVAGADTAIVLTDSRNARNPDAHTLLVALAIEEIAPSVYTIVEVQDSNNMSHFDRTAVDETVCRSGLSELLLAQCALNPHLGDVYRELYTYQTHGNEIYQMERQERWKTFRGAFEELMGRRVIALGGRRARKNLLNPPADAPLQPGDLIWVIALEQP
jgi:Trk K+ transport system NAD-binding subunit